MDIEPNSKEAVRQRDNVVNSSKFDSINNEGRLIGNFIEIFSNLH